MRKLLLVGALIAVAITNVSCTADQRAASEAKVKQVLASIANGARVAVSVVKQSIDTVCANTGAVATSSMVVRVGLGTQSGPNTNENLRNLDTSLDTLNKVCASAAANPNDPALQSLLRTAWVAYQNAKTAQRNLGVSQ